MALFSSTQPSLRARILPRFPAQVLAGNGMTITKSGGTYTFDVAQYADIPITAIANITSDRLLGRDTTGNGAVEELGVSGGLEFSGAGTLQVTDQVRTRHAAVVLYNNGAVLTPGVKGDLYFSVPSEINEVTLLADQVGSIVIDIWMDTIDNYPPDNSDSITGSLQPTLAVQAASRIGFAQMFAAGWTTGVPSGNTLRFNIDSVSTVTRVTVVLAMRS